MNEYKNFIEFLRNSYPNKTDEWLINKLTSMIKNDLHYRECNKDKEPRDQLWLDRIWKDKKVKNLEEQFEQEYFGEWIQEERNKILDDIPYVESTLPKLKFRPLDVRSKI